MAPGREFLWTLLDIMRVFIIRAWLLVGVESESTTGRTTAEAETTDESAKEALNIEHFIGLL